VSTAKTFASVIDQKHRLRIPQDVLPHLQWIKNDKTDAYLLVLELSRLRLLSPRNVDDSPTLRKLTSLVEEVPSLLDAAEFEPVAQVVLPVRLVPITISKVSTGVRFTVPKETLALATAGVGGRRVLFVLSSGFVEIWFPEATERALTIPPSEALAE
jgi:hypothetical protein